MFFPPRPPPTLATQLYIVPARVGQLLLRFCESSKWTRLLFLDCFKFVLHISGKNVFFLVTFLSPRQESHRGGFVRWTLVVTVMAVILSCSVSRCYLKGGFSASVCEEESKADVLRSVSAHLQNNRPMVPAAAAAVAVSRGGRRPLGEESQINDANVQKHDHRHLVLLGTRYTHTLFYILKTR